MIVKYTNQDLNVEGKIVLYFGAEWCSPCKALKPTLEKMDYYFYYVDADQNQDLVHHLGVMSIPTLIALEGGQEIGRTIGMQSEEQIKTLCQK